MKKMFRRMLREDEDEIVGWMVFVVVDEFLKILRHTVVGL